ncbi:FAD:protein FMN transferase [Gilvimarinus algae]|uniref:FAD:protein FMN transferase n=1 Tax=Gilvimarinus algae TaxID=3058037 RepID=A0ABT8TL61_9GAMM|nr:FAD:protein FMN transferase [Gilvimarinus sp. SDUM040014]MDO3383082.1 FAD:protein FMN transferase [Gilvimarinus sp. SDUM040014]
MASPCELFVRLPKQSDACELIERAASEAQRIEQHFSRYRQDNPLYRINHSGGQATALDDEYARLFEYALQLYHLSDGQFDISSGSLRHLWVFDAAQRQAPAAAAIDAALELVGLARVHWQKPWLRLPAGMQLDFGGIAKEYAVDRAAQIIEQHGSADYLVNFGGDCRCRASVTKPWRIAIESVCEPPNNDNGVTLVEGAIATSGTTKRYFKQGGKRYGHILDPRSGRPVEEAPLSVSVVAQTCVEAGSLSTLAMLQGANARAFLEQQGVLHWVLRASDHS